MPRFDLRRSTKLIVAATALVLLCVCCDPGYRLKPVGWSAVDAMTWTKDFGDFKLRTKGIGGLIGEWWFEPALEVVYNSKPIAVQSAEVHTARGTFTGEIYDKRPIPPGNGGYHLPVSWTLDQKEAASRILGARCEILLNMKVGEENRELHIEYQR